MKLLKIKKVNMTLILIIALVNTVGAQSPDMYRTNASGSYTGETLFSNASFIMDFTCIYRNVTDEEMSSYEIPMFIMPETIQYTPSTLNLNYGELVFNPKIDDNFELFCDFIYANEEFTLEELYANAINLPYGFRFKVGRFLSSFGWHNLFHKHQWNFFDAPLIQTAFFGNNGLLEDTIQVGWEAPVDFYLLIGLEIARGKNLQSFGTESFGAPSIEVTKSRYPNLYVFFIDSKIDLSDLIVTWGLSLAGGGARNNENFMGASGTGIFGTTFMAGFNLNFKYNFDRFSYIEWCNEMIYRSITGDYFQGGGPVVTSDISKNQIGAYSQLIIKPFEYFRIGARGEILQNNVTIDGTKADIPTLMQKYTGMIDFNPTEYTQIRLQFNYNKEFYNENDIAADVYEAILQFNFAFGSHGAHLI